MPTIKKQFITIHNLLTELRGKKITKERFAQLESLMVSKTMSTTFKTDRVIGNVTHIYCYYHKVWEAIDDIPYGKKANTAHGYMRMCKEGVSRWTKQQSVMKKDKSQLLDDVSNGLVEAIDLPESIAKIEETSKIIVPHSYTINDDV